MRIDNKPLFILFLLLDVLVSGYATYYNCTQGLNTPLSVLAAFIPLPMLWQTNINDYQGKTKIGKRITDEGGGYSLFLFGHAGLLVLLWVIGSCLRSSEDGVIAVSVVGIIILMVIISFAIAFYVDAKAKQ